MILKYTVFQISQRNLTIIHYKGVFQRSRGCGHEKFSRGQAPGPPVFFPQLVPCFSLTPNTNLDSKVLLCTYKFFTMMAPRSEQQFKEIWPLQSIIFPFKFCRKKCLFVGKFWPSAPPPKIMLPRRHCMDTINTQIVSTIPMIFTTSAIWRTFISCH